MCIYDQLTDLADVCNYYIHIYIQTSLILQQHYQFQSSFTLMNQKHYSWITE